MLVQLRRPARGEGADLPARVNVSPRGRLTVILKVTDICNIGCTFCSVGPAGTQKLSDEDFELLATELELVAESWQLRGIELTFHGGEPTAMGAGWLDRACERLKKLSIEVAFSMQTNLISLNDRLIEVIKKHRIALGSSIDPLSGERVDFQGRDTFARWVENYKRVNAAGVQVGAIFIVTKASYQRGVELYRICEELNRHSLYPFGLQVQPVYPQGRAASESDMLLRPEELGRFFVDIYEEWERRGRTIGLAPLDSFASNLDPHTPNVGLQCSFGPGCATSHCGIDHHLNVAGCGRRLDSRGVFGNLHDGHLHDILRNSEEKRKLSVRTERLRNAGCHDCKYFGLCHGGCPDDADLHYMDVSKKYYWCEGYYMLYEAIDRHQQEKTRRATVANSPRREARSRYPSPSPSLSGDDRARQARRQGGPRQHAIVVGSNVEDFLRPSETVGPVERWLVPSANDNIDALVADGYRLRETRAGLFRLFVPNRDVRRLRMCLDVVQSARVRVVLFEGDEQLSSALNLCNAYGTNVILDVPAIGATTVGREQLRAASNRYLFDPMWRVQVAPFAEMLRSSAMGETVTLQDRFGLRPLTVLPFLPEDFDTETHPYSRALATYLRNLARGRGEDIHRAYAGCADCGERPACASRFARGDGAPCEPALQALATTLREHGEMLAARLRQLGQAHGDAGTEAEL
jgi:uncharacterized protein